MLIKPILVSLLQLILLTTTASGGLCTLKYNISVVATGDDPGGLIEFGSSFTIKRLSNGNDKDTVIAEGSTGNDLFKLPAEQGTCQYEKPTGYNHTLWSDEKTFHKCGKETFYFASNAIEDDHAGDDTMWRVEETFKCNGTAMTIRQCGEGGKGSGGDFNITCTNEYHINVLFPALKQTLQKAMNNNNYNGLYKEYKKTIQKMRQADMDYANEIDTCKKEGNWAMYESCAIFFFKPIIAVVASYRNRTSPIDDEKKIEEWIKPEFTSNRTGWSSNGPWVNEMVSFMTEVFSKDQLDSGLFTREMVYTMLHRATYDGNNTIFQWDQSPISRRIKDWYEYAKGNYDEELQNIFNLTVDARVREFCKNEKNRSLLCSFMAAKNKYELSIMYLPKNNRLGVVPVSAYYAADGLYSSFNEDLKRSLETIDTKEEIHRLGERLGKYFATLAKFDNALAKTDLARINSTIKNNEARLITNRDSMVKIVEKLQEDMKECTILNMIQIAVELAVAVAATIATAGAAAPAAGAVVAGSAVTTTIGIKQVIKIANDTAKAIKEVKDTVELESDALSKASSVAVSINAFAAKIKEKQQAIDDMHKIVNAVQAESSFNSTQAEVQRFLKRYTNYDPTINKTDLMDLNKSYSEMLDSFENGIVSGGVLCKVFVAGTAKPKITDAKRTWAAIYTLLEEMVDQQDKMMEALVKVVRSKLDESATKMLEPDLIYYGYNFEMLVRHQLLVRVAAQECCNTAQFMNIQKVMSNCNDIRDQVFLHHLTRAKIEVADKILWGKLESLTNSDGLVNKVIPFIPVTTSNDPSMHVINWKKLMDGEVVEFALPVNDSTGYLANYGWNPSPDKVALLKSLEIFIPNNILETDNTTRQIRFHISAIQEDVVINRMPNSTRYTVKSENPLSTESEYSTNEKSCDPKNVEPDLFANNGTKYCLLKVTGVFTNDLSPPVSMYSKFLIRLIDGYNYTERQAMKELAPANDTLQLRARIKVYSNGPSAGDTLDQVQPQRKSARTMLPAKFKPPVIQPCGPKEYRKFIDAKRQECVPCRIGTVPVAHGSYCADEVAVKRMVEKGFRI